MGEVRCLWFNLFVVLSVATIVRTEDCVYTVFIRTESIINGGTNSVIGLTLYDGHRRDIRIPNLVYWGGLMGPGYKYFQGGNLDIFSGRGRCLDKPVCGMNLTSDGSDQQHGWYCNYVEVTTTGVHKPCSQQLFPVEQWVATHTYPFNLTVIRDYCKSGWGPAVASPGSYKPFDSKARRHVAKGCDRPRDPVL